MGSGKHVGENQQIDADDNLNHTYINRNKGMQQGSQKHTWYWRGYTPFLDKPR